MPSVLWPPAIERPYLGLPINNIGDGLNGGSEKVGAGCAELNSGYNARCRSFEMYGSCTSRDPSGGGRGASEQEVERKEGAGEEAGVNRG